MSKRKVSEGWYSPVYSMKVAQQWANALWAVYPRASDLLLEICGKSVRDTCHLAQKSQRGWENWKYAVKNIEQQYSMKDSGFFKTHEQFILYVNNYTIHMLSSLMHQYLKSIENIAKDEVSWLTYWFQKVL